MIQRLLLILSISLAAYSQDAGPSLAIVNGTLIDVRNGNETPNSVVIIQGEHITQVGAEGQLQIPEGAKTIDARGKWIVPGFMDMHAHVSSDDSDEIPLQLFLANGVTTIRDPGGFVSVARLLRNAIDSGKRLGPRLFYCGNILDGNPPVFPSLDLLVDSPQRARSAVNFLADQDVDCIKVYNNIKERELKAIVRTARSRDVPVIGHIPRSMTMTHAVELGMQCLEHVRVTGREILPAEVADKIDFLPYGQREPLLWQKFDLQSEKMQALVKFLAARRVPLDPTLTVEEASFVVPDEDQIKNPDNRFLPASLVKKWTQEPGSEALMVPPELKQTAIEGFEKRKQFVGMCARAGVPILTGTDGPFLGTLVPGFALQHELQLLVQAGLTPLQAIQASTINSAKTLRRNQDLGQVAPGYLADLVILKGDPLKDIHNAAKVESVIKDGAVYKAADLLKRPVSE